MNLSFSLLSLSLFLSHFVFSLFSSFPFFRVSRTSHVVTFAVPASSFQPPRCPLGIAKTGYSTTRNQFVRGVVTPIVDSANARSFRSAFPRIVESRTLCGLRDRNKNGAYGVRKARCGTMYGVFSFQGIVVVDVVYQEIW